MCNKTSKRTQKVFSRLGMCLLCSGGFIATLATASDAQSNWNPEVIRGAGTTNAAVLRLAYQASFPNGSLDSSVDHLGVGPMVPGDPLIPDSNPTVSSLPGEILVSIHRPLSLAPDLIPSESVWATPVDFGPGSVVRISATFRAPVGPIPGGGFAFGLNARTGAKDDLGTETRIATTINVRPGFLVRLNVPFGSTQGTAMVLPAAVRDAIFSTSDPQPFTLSLTINRVRGTGKSVLKVGDQVFSLPFVLSDFRADGGPTITAVGPGIAVNSNGPGQTASVHVRNFRIYTNVGG
jgi:hypothetical protein